MWVDLSALGLKVSQSLNRGTVEGTLITIHGKNSAQRVEQVKSKLLKRGFEFLGVMGVDGALCHVMQKNQPTFTPVDLRNWVDGYHDSMIRKQMSPIKVEIYDILERIAITEEPRWADLAESFSADDIPFGDNAS